MNSSGKNSNNFDNAANVRSLPVSEGEWVSALADGQLPATDLGIGQHQESEALLSQLLASPSAKAAWARQHWVRDALHSPELALRDRSEEFASIVMARISQADALRGDFAPHKMAVMPGPVRPVAEHNVGALRADPIAAECARLRKLAATRGIEAVRECPPGIPTHFHK